MASSSQNQAAPPPEFHPKWSQRSLCTLDDLASVKTIEEIMKWNAALEFPMAEIDQNLQEQLKGRPQLLRHKEKILREKIPSLLTPLSSEASHLEMSLKEASEVAKNVSSKVVEIDAIRQRVVAASKRTNDIIELKNCLKNAQLALSNNDYDEAVKHIARYLRFDASVVDLETQRQLRQAEQSLISGLKEQLGLAISQNRISEIAHYTQLFAPLGLFDEGISHYAKYLERQIKADFDSILRQAEDATSASKQVESTSQKTVPERVSYAAALAQLVQRAHKRLKIAKPTLEQAFGPSGLIHAVLILQPVLNSYCSTLLDQFMKIWQGLEPQNNILKSRREAEVALAKAASESFMYTSAPRTQPKNPLEFAPLLDQLVIISQTIEVNSRFTAAVIAQAKDALTKAKQNLADRPHTSSDISKHIGTIETQNGASSVSSNMKRESFDELERIEQAQRLIEAHSTQLEGYIQHGPLSERLVELLGHYTRFEQYYMQESINYAIFHDTNALLDDTHKTSSICDDVFFVLKESANRAKATYNSNAICAVINLIDAELNSGYLEVLKDRSSAEALEAARNSHISSSSLVSGPTALIFGQVPSARSVLIAINNLEQSCEYIARLKSDFEVPSSKIFALQPLDLQKVMSCCDDLERTKRKFHQILISQIEHVFTAIQPRLISHFELLSQFTYLPSESEYNQMQINDLTSQQLLQGISEIVVPIQNVLSQPNFDVLVHLVAKCYVSSLEKVVVQKKFNQLGAELLDRDLRTIQTYFSQLAQRNVRDKFTRIIQVAYLLNVYSLEEAKEQWEANKSDSKQGWVFSSQDAKKILALRVDFPRDQIAKLKL